MVVVVVVVVAVVVVVVVVVVVKIIVKKKRVTVAVMSRRNQVKARVYSWSEIDEIAGGVCEFCFFSGRLKTTCARTIRLHH